MPLPKPPAKPAQKATTTHRAAAPKGHGNRLWSNNDRPDSTHRPGPNPLTTGDGRMKVAVFAGLVLATAAQQINAQPQFELVWSDEFEGTQIDTTKWTHEVNAWGGGNNELQFYTARPENSFVSDGHLTIRAIRENYTGRDERDNVIRTRGYTSARLNTRFKGDWLYGRFEVRAKSPRGQGLWPAAWMLPTDNVYGGWAASGEIDILEIRGENTNEAVFSLHYGGPWPQNAYTSGSVATPDLSENFFVYTVEWLPGLMRWYLNGSLVQTRNSWWSSGGPFPAPFDQRFHFLLNLAVGGNFLQNPPADANYFPQDFVIDYVRVYRLLGSTPFGSESLPLPGRLEVEDYDRGGPGVAYVDSTPLNLGGAYRPDEGVDLEATTDVGGGFNLGWVAPGEWLEYSCESAGGIFQVTARVASLATPGVARLLFRSPDNPETPTVTIAIPATGGWQTWRTVIAGPVELPPGPVTVRLEIVEGEFNMNWINFAATNTDVWMVY